MGQETSIEWTEATWNPIRGCSRISQGCVNCYAETQAARWSGPGGPYEGLINDKRRWNGVVRMVPEHLLDPLRWERPRLVFVNSMSDLFHESLGWRDIAAVFGAMAMAPRHTFQLLTKRADVMRLWFMELERMATASGCHPADICVGVLRETLCGFRATPEICKAHGRWLDHKSLLTGTGKRPDVAQVWPLPNAWVGVSVEDQRVAERVEHLSQVPAAVRWVSAEPLIGRLDLGGSEWASVDWIVVGGESGHGARKCEAEWIYEVLRGAEKRGTPVFVKQLGAAFSCAGEGVFGPQTAVSPVLQRLGLTTILKHPKGGDMAEWPLPLRVRQWPKGGAR